MNRLQVSPWMKLAGVLLATGVGLLHLVEAPEYYGEVRYVGVLFVLNAIGAFVAAFGIARDHRAGWLLGLAMSGGAIVAYVLSRTVGLPGFDEGVDDLFEPMGVLAVLVEGAFVIVAWLALSRRVAGSALPVS